jgi:hypothetical protein
MLCAVAFRTFHDFVVASQVIWLGHRAASSA